MTKPGMAVIAERQAAERNLRRQVAADHFYKTAKRVRFGGASLAIVFALIAPVVLLFDPDLGPTLGAIAALWLFVARLVLEPIRHAYQLKGATAQELFDCDVLGIEWNAALTRPLANEEILQAGRSIERANMRWYPAGGADDWPASVLICQRSNAVWARRQHNAYGWLLAGVAAGWVVIGIAIAVVHGASLGEYLTTIALPSLPAVLDGTELSRGHRDTAARRGELEERADALLISSAVPQDLRDIQDQVFELRKDAPLVPQWFYNLVKTRYEEGMQYAAAQRAPQATSATSATSAGDMDGSAGQ
jgi:hypothetical protein